MKKIAILGSTGSIGTQSLTVIDWHPQLFRVELLSVNKNIYLLKQQMQKYKPSYAVVLDYEAGKELMKEAKFYQTKILIGMAGLMEAIEETDFDIMITAVAGSIGLIPTIAAIKKGADIALANKETLVAAGQIVMELARLHNVDIIPVDSEHSAIFQCLKGEKLCEVHKLILTASGGPFKGLPRDNLTDITPEQAMKHPKWNMGAKISIDSATLMNKGLEVIEAHWLFGVDYDNIDVVVHPQSIIHSMVHFTDGSMLAHLGPTDMKIPIQYALSFPDRFRTKVNPIDLSEVAQLTFERPDRKTFPALDLAYHALMAGGTMPAVLNGANEIAVSLFLEKKICFLEIPQLIKQVMNSHNLIKNPGLEQIITADDEARLLAKKYLAKVGESL